MVKEIAYTMAACLALAAALTFAPTLSAGKAAPDQPARQAQAG